MLRLSSEDSEHAAEMVVVSFDSIHGNSLHGNQESFDSKKSSEYTSTPMRHSLIGVENDSSNSSVSRGTASFTFHCYIVIFSMLLIKKNIGQVSLPQSCKRRVFFTVERVHL